MTACPTNRWCRCSTSPGRSGTPALFSPAGQRRSEPWYMASMLLLLSVIACSPPGPVHPDPKAPGFVPPTDTPSGAASAAAPPSTPPNTTGLATLAAPGEPCSIPTGVTYEMGPKAHQICTASSKDGINWTDDNHLVAR